MRIDKFIKFFNIIKSRKYAKIACERGLIYVNEKKVKASYKVKKKDKIKIELIDRNIEIEILEVPEKNLKKVEFDKYVKILNLERKKIA
ncbi:MAG: S4 domain-containing protein [Candidatus Hydrothermales bacterium]